MYSSFFHMKENPFGETPNPRYFYASSTHQSARDDLTSALQRNKGFATLIGEVGSGKSLLLRILLEKFSSHSPTAYIFHPTLEPKDLLATVCEEFGLALTEAESSGELRLSLARLYQFLLDQGEAARPAVLFIDEAQRMPFETLEFVRLLSNLETDQRKLLQIVLAGQPELEQKLSLHSLRQLQERISVYSRLESLSLDETCRYINHRLDIAGGRNFLSLDPSAYNEIHRRSKGCPRKINFYMELALLGAEQSGHRCIDQQLIRRALESPDSKDSFLSRVCKVFSPYSESWK